MPLIWMLGPLEVGDPRRACVEPLRHKQRELLTLLLIRAGSVVSAGEIIDTLWGEHPPPSARANLYNYVGDLRRVLQRVSPEAGLRPRHSGHGYRLDVRPDECDAVLFERLAIQGHQALAAKRPVQAVDHLTRALALWRGPVLDGLDGEWLAPTVARLEEAHVGAIEDHVQARLVLGQYASLSVELTAATARYPLRERLWGQLMTALYGSGRRAEALVAYARLQDLLDRELGVRPGAAVRTLHRHILADG